jgi:hypothetical protein
MEVTMNFADKRPIAGWPGKPHVRIRLGDGSFGLISAACGAPMTSYDTQIDGYHDRRDKLCEDCISILRLKAKELSAEADRLRETTGKQHAVDVGENHLEVYPVELGLGESPIYLSVCEGQHHCEECGKWEHGADPSCHLPPVAACYACMAIARTEVD